CTRSAAGMLVDVDLVPADRGGAAAGDVPARCRADAGPRPARHGGGRGSRGGRAPGDVPGRLRRGGRPLVRAAGRGRGVRGALAGGGRRPPGERAAGRRPRPVAGGTAGRTRSGGRGAPWGRAAASPGRAAAGGRAPAGGRTRSPASLVTRRST